MQLRPNTENGRLNSNPFPSFIAEDEFGKPEMVDTQKGRTRTGSSAEMAVDQLQASEKLIAGM